MHEDKKRSGLKAVSWRIIATSTGMFLVYVFTGRWELTAGFGIADVVLKLLFYFLHERLWNMTQFGRILGGPITAAMRAPPVLVQPSESVQNTIQKMVNSHIGAAIVEENAKPVGIITEKDILKWELVSKENPEQTMAREIMSSPIIVINHDASLTNALQLMHNNHIRRLAVTNDEKIEGIVTERRILATLL
jgi:predicted transcriptional regulator